MVGFRKEARDAARTAFKKNAAERKAARIAAYEADPKKCGNAACSNNLNFNQANDGVLFCSRSCSNSVVKRLGSEESRKKVSASMTKPPRTLWNCSQCGTAFTSLTKKRICSDDCRKSARIQSGRNAAATMRENGTFSGWHNRRGEPSYPEKYFILVFDTEGITGWQRELKVGRWFIDFAFTDKKLAVEVDGRQHQDADRKKSDELKDHFLRENGWEVIRISWANPRTDKGKQQLHPQVRVLLERLRK